MIPDLKTTTRALSLPFFDSDLCVKCNVCTAACPVAGATSLFPGPKAVGPQLGRYWRPDHHVVDPATTWCSGCGVCSRVCPHGVPVAEMNIVSKAELRPGLRLGLRDWGLARPAEAARWMRPIRPLARFALRSTLLRRIADGVGGLAARAPLPIVADRPLSRTRADLSGRTGPVIPAWVAFFHGCSTED
jgi:glycerol-3-phosphate dehydrogenase subunit C